MIKALAYCAYLYRAGISLPQPGVSGSALREITRDDLRLLWSEVEWPFAGSSLQRYAVEFHQVISHMFSQGAVAPFRLLSLFDDQRSLADFTAAHHAEFVADLKRLETVVQVECVLYPVPEPAVRTSGRNYLEQKASQLHRAQDFIESMRVALGPLIRELRVRESKKGSRIFVLVDRGNEQRFHSTVQDLPVPERLARRTSGPWPAAEFLSDSLKMPQLVK